MTDPCLSAKTSLCEILQAKSFRNISGVVIGSVCPSTIETDPDKEDMIHAQVNPSNPPILSGLHKTEKTCVGSI